MLNCQLPDDIFSGEGYQMALDAWDRFEADDILEELRRPHGLDFRFCNQFNFTYWGA